MDDGVSLFHGGSIFDGHRHRRGVGAVVERGTIAAVAADRDLTAYADRASEVVDLAGGLLLPGFQDAHAHPVQGGLERMRCDLSDVHTRQAYLDRIARYASDHPEVAWISGGGWAMSVFGPGGPTAVELDTVVPDRPVFLLNRDHHGAWVNSRALHLAGVDARTPDPGDGRVQRDDRGRPTGTLHEGAMELVARHLPVTTSEEYYQALLVGQAYLHSLGVTAWQDAILGDYAGMTDFSTTYLRAVEAGDLTARVRGALWWERDLGLEQLPSLLERRERFTRGRFAPGAVKIMQDGIAENFTAAMSRPYLDGCGCSTGNAGLSFIDPERLREYVARLDAHDFQVHVHAIGDRAVREALDAFEAAAGVNGPSSARHHIAHLQVVHPEDVPRFGRLGVCANLQPLWAHSDDQMVGLTIPFLEPGLAGWQYPFADLARAGARLVMGSDWPVTTPDPLQGIHVAVNRWAHGESGRAGSEPFLPGQRLTLEQAFAAYTSGSAFVNHLDGTGTLQQGAAADLAVLDRDPFLGDPTEVGATRVVATYVDGVRVAG